MTVFLEGNETTRFENDEQRTATNKKPSRTHATKGLQAREIHAPGTCQARGGHPGQ